jgi:hypothetical protein
MMFPMHASIRSRIVGVSVARTSVTVAAPGAPAPAGQASGVDDTTRRARGLANSGQYDLAPAEITAATLWFTGAPESNVAVSARIVDGAGIDAAVRF